MKKPTVLKQLEEANTLLAQIKADVATIKGTLPKKSFEPPVCVDCMYCVPDSYFSEVERRFKYAKCAHPKAGGSLVHKKVAGMYCSTVRELEMCGTEGKLFKEAAVPADWKISPPWWKFW